MNAVDDQPKQAAPAAASRAQTDLSALVEFTRALASRDDIFEILFSVVSRLADLLGVDRGSIILRPHAGTGDEETALVVATSDDAAMKNHRLPLAKYPEIRQVLSTGQPLVISDVKESALLQTVLSAAGTPDFSSMALIPIIGEDGPIAVLVLKSAERAEFSEYDIIHAQAVANATAIALNNARTLRALRAEKQALSSAQSKDAERLRELSRYLDVFESSGDAMIVADESGAILFVNPRATELTRSDAPFLVGTCFGSLFDQSAQPALAGVLGTIARGECPAGLDLALGSLGSRTIVAVSFSQVQLGEGRAVLATMRDVTVEREMARELAHTKEFLERVIESSADGIVSADLRGNVLVYNKAARGLFGYERAEVVGHLTVDKLYPEGGARDIMRRIRRPEHGGAGVLEEHRVEMLTKTGELIAVNLSAALVLDGKRPIGTVGIFTDIRDRLAMEARLGEAQRQLEERRRTDAISEVAGAAAHELNQPLTSVMGYAEYLKRRINDDPGLLHAVEVILGETQRMADIVRKVGRITRYETKPYVGSSKIVDLELSSTPET